MRNVNFLLQVFLKPGSNVSDDIGHHFSDVLALLFQAVSFQCPSPTAPLTSISVSLCFRRSLCWFTSVTGFSTAEDSFSLCLDTVRSPNKNPSIQYVGQQNLQFVWHITDTAIVRAVMIGLTVTEAVTSRASSFCITMACFCPVLPLQKAYQLLERHPQVLSSRIAMFGLSFGTSVTLKMGVYSQVMKVRQLKVRRDVTQPSAATLIKDLSNSSGSPWLPDDAERLGSGSSQMSVLS